MYSAKTKAEEKAKALFWRGKLYRRLSKVHPQELPALKNPLTPEEQTPELMAIYHQMEKYAEENAGNGNGPLYAEVCRLAEEEEKKRPEPYSQKRILRTTEVSYSLGKIAKDLELDPERALKLIEPEAAQILPEDTFLNVDTLFVDEDILKVQKAIAEAALMAAPKVSKSKGGGWTPPYVVVGAERDTPTQLMEYDALSAFLQKREKEAEKLRQNQKTVAERYEKEIRRAILNRSVVTEISPWAEKYEKMKELAARRQEEINDRYAEKSRKWEFLLSDYWGYAGAFFAQTLTLWLCLLVFITGCWTVGLTDSVKLHGLTMLNVWKEFPHYVPGLFADRNIIWVLALLFLEACACRGAFCVYVFYSNPAWARKTFSMLFGLVVSFAAIDLLFQPFLYARFFSFQHSRLWCVFLQAPLATLFHINFWWVQDMLGESRKASTSKPSKDSSPSKGSFLSNESPRPKSRPRRKWTIDYGPDIPCWGQTLILFLCMFAFSLCWWSFSMSGSVPARALNMLRFWGNISDCAARMFGEHDAIPFLILIALEAWGCRAFFDAKFPYSNLISTVFWLVVTFVLTDLLIQPFIYHAVSSWRNYFLPCSLLQAPLATLLHMGVWGIRERRS